MIGNAIRQSDSGDAFGNSISIPATLLPNQLFWSLCATEPRIESIILVHQMYFRNNEFLNNKFMLNKKLKY